MGMSASQARFLSLTARKNNTEFEGQQINQQRVALSNQSANLNKESLTLKPPTVPSVLAFTETVYSWKSNGVTNTITQMYPTTGTFDYSTTETTAGGMKKSADNTSVKRELKAGTGVNSTSPTIPNSQGLSPGDTGYTEEYKFIPAEYIYKNSEGKELTEVTREDQLAELRKASDSQNSDEAFLCLDGQYFSKEELNSAQWSGSGQSNVPSYKGAASTTQDAMATASGSFDKADNGQLKSVTINGKTIPLTATSVKDDAAYEEAMNKYNYETDLYNKALEDVNSKLAILQAQDKTLEVQLKQLDTEQEAIQTEMDAVKKVIDKNIEGSFKAFG